MEEPYNRLDNAELLNSDQGSILGPNRGMPAENSKPTLKMYKGLVLLTVIEICIAILMFLLGVTCTSVDRNNAWDRFRATSCLFGTGIWVGFLCIIAAASGFLALRVPYGHRGFMIAFMVLCILATVADGILIIFSSIWIEHNKYEYKYYGNSTSLAAIILNAFLLLAAIIHMILSIISSAFLCYNFNCCARNQEVIIVYTPNSGNNVNSETIKFLSPEVVIGKNAQIISA